jgi:pimeloyl-ACP methyl ester carboxylesterase
MPLNVTPWSSAYSSKEEVGAVVGPLNGHIGLAIGRFSPMMGSIQAQYECVRVLSETEFFDDLKAIEVPVPVMHGEDDQICPFPTTGARSVKLLRHGTLKSYPGLPYGMPTTHADVINADLLAFIES